jgi:peptide deformylase
MADVVEPVEAAAEPLPLRFFGDQVLRRVAAPVTDIDGDLVQLARRMLVTMDEANGVGLAAPQVGRTVRMFVHALGDEAPEVLINPEIVASAEEWTYSEGCLSIPGLYFDIVRPGTVHVRATGIDGRDLEIEADELLGRVIQHELDHLDGILFVDRLTGAARQQATLELADRVAGTLGANDPLLTGRPIPALRRKLKLRI